MCRRQFLQAHEPDNQRTGPGKTGPKNTALKPRRKPKALKKAASSFILMFEKKQGGFNLTHAQ
jgi:hypothetical protein